MKSLKKADGTPIDELSELFDPDIQQKFKSILNKPSAVTAEDFLEELNNPEIFNKIFQIVE